jgi:hypothetical protein
MYKGYQKHLMALAAVAALSPLSSGVALAEKPSWFGDGPAQGQWLLGIKAGVMKNEGHAIEEANNTGVLVGYTFARPVGGGSASVEAEFTSTSSDGDFTQDSFVGAPGSWQIDSKALYMSYRTSGTIYFKGKGGVVIADTKYKTNSTLSDVKQDEAAASFGAGMGVRVMDRANVELEYTGGFGDNDVNFASLGVNFSF